MKENVPLPAIILNTLGFAEKVLGMSDTSHRSVDVLKYFKLKAAK